MDNLFRNTDSIETSFPRKDRMIICDEGYYYRTREEGLIGPFNTESEALFDLNVFLKVTEIEKELQSELFLQVAAFSPLLRGENQKI